MYPVTKKEDAPERGIVQPQAVASVQTDVATEEMKKPAMTMSRSDSRHTGVAAHAA